jgi:hypothetical protein
MTEPMAVIAQSITASIEVNNDQVKELQKKRFTRKQLEQKLFVEKKSVESFPVDDPRTVCTHHSCVEVRSDFEGRQEMAVIYKTMCHRPCGLSGVDKNKKGHPDLQYCWAINRDTGLCKECKHSWMDHMHVYYEYRPMTYKYQNEDINRDLMKNASDIELQEEAIRMKKTAIAEYEIEHRMVQEAGIQFGFFLKRHAITPYNDATLEYLDHLIDREKMKVQNGGTKKALDDLEKYKREHIQKVDTLQKAMERGDSGEVLDDKGVLQLIVTIYGLPHFGKDLKKIVATNEKSAEATYREKSFNVSAGAHWNRQTTGKKKQPKSQQNYNYSRQANQASAYYSDPYYSDSYSDTIPGSFPGSSPWSSPSEYATAVPETYQIPLRPDQQAPAGQYTPNSGSYPNSGPSAPTKSRFPWRLPRLW